MWVFPNSGTSSKKGNLKVVRFPIPPIALSVEEGPLTEISGKIICKEDESEVRPSVHNQVEHNIPEEVIFPESEFNLQDTMNYSEWLDGLQVAGQNDPRASDESSASQSSTINLAEQQTQATPRSISQRLSLSTVQLATAEFPIADCDRDQKSTFQGGQVVHMDDSLPANIVSEQPRDSSTSRGSSLQVPMAEFTFGACDVTAKQTTFPIADYSSMSLSDMPFDRLKGNVQLLNLSNNKISNVTLLSEYRDLRKVSLARNRLALSLPVETFARLTRLSVLDVSENRLCSLDGLTGCKSLKILNASKNRIRVLSGVDACTLLEDLDVSGNLMSGSLETCGLSWLVGMSKLRKLDFRWNPICDREDLMVAYRSLLPNVSELNGEVRIGFADHCISKRSPGNYLTNTTTSKNKSFKKGVPAHEPVNECKRLLGLLSDAILRKELLLRKFGSQPQHLQSHGEA